MKEILKVREPTVTQPRSCNVRSKSQETLLKFGDLSSVREYPMCIYSVGQVLRSVTTDKVKGRTRSAAHVVASCTAANDPKKTTGLIQICLRHNFTNKVTLIFKIYIYILLIL